MSPPRTHATERANSVEHKTSFDTYRDSCVLLEPRRFFLAVNGVQVKLSRTQFLIAACLVSNIDRITRFEDLWTTAWNEYGPVNRKNIQMMVSRLREKLVRSGLRIESVVDVGYILLHDRCCREKVGLDNVI